MTKRAPKGPATRGEQLAVSWLDQHEANGRLPRYMQHAAMTLRHWLAYCAYHKVDPLQADHWLMYRFVERLHAFTGRVASHSERRRQRAVLRGWYRWLHENGATDTDLAMPLRPNPKARPKPKGIRRPPATESDPATTNTL